MKELMPVLAIDPARNMGWALSPLISGVWDLSLKRDESMGMRFMRLRAKLNELLDNYRIQLVAYEAARNAAPKMQGSLVFQAQLQAIIVDWATTAGIESKGYSPKTIKLWATGNGNASKDMMVVAARNRWPGVTVLDDDHADALLLWQMANEEFKFLTMAAKGNVIPAIIVPEKKPKREKKPFTAKTKRIFERAGRADASPEQKRSFEQQLRDAKIKFMDIPSKELAKIITGERKLTDFLPNKAA